MELVLKTAGVFVVLLGVLVAVHEFGHFAVAKLFGMNVQEFSFGFGPLLRRLGRRNGTEYNVRAVPLGGFVRIAGMEPGEEGEAEGGFNSRPIWQRTLVILAGPFMSLALGYFVFIMLGLVWGFPTGRPSVAVVDKASPAARAGMRPGDVIMSLDGKKITDATDFTLAVFSSPEKKLRLGLKRDGRLISVEATPVLQKNPNYDNLSTKDRKSPKYANNPLYRKEVGRLGVTMGAELQRAGFVRSVTEGTRQTVDIVTGIVTTLFSKKIGQNVGGIVMIGYMTSEVVKQGIDSVFAELGALSLMLGVLNLIPWPILDGGHLIFMAIEKLRGKKMEPEPWYVVQTVGLAVIVLLAVFLVYFDLSRIITHKLP